MIKLDNISFKKILFLKNTIKSKYFDTFEK